LRQKEGGGKGLPGGPGVSEANGGGVGKGQDRVVSQERGGRGICGERHWVGGSGSLHHSPKLRRKKSVEGGSGRPTLQNRFRG